MPLILIADDDRALVQMLELALSQYQTVNASDGASILHAIATAKPDLVLLDLGLPDVDGAVLISKIRQKSKVPIIILSGRHEQADVVMALQAGADDFIKKPFELEDLDVRIEAVLHRCRGWADPPLPPRGPKMLKVGTLSMAAVGEQFIDGKPLHLSPTQRRLLLALAERAGEFVTGTELAKCIWDPAEGYDRNAVSTVLDCVRVRLRAHPLAPEIVTRRRVGFRLEAPLEP